jgi:hypothetical protein
MARPPLLTTELPPAVAGPPGAHLPPARVAPAVAAPPEYALAPAPPPPPPPPPPLPMTCHRRKTHANKFKLDQRSSQARAQGAQKTSEHTCERASAHATMRTQRCTRNDAGTPHRTDCTCTNDAHSTSAPVAGEHGAPKQTHCPSEDRRPRQQRLRHSALPACGNRANGLAARIPIRGARLPPHIGVLDITAVCYTYQLVHIYIRVFFFASKNGGARREWRNLNLKEGTDAVQKKVR